MIYIIYIYYQFIIMVQYLCGWIAYLVCMSTHGNLDPTTPHAQTVCVGW